jgi:heterodisulfide reductase subunit B
MSKLSLFLGCIVPNRYPGIEKATNLCLEKLDIDCLDLLGASCCPAPGVFRSFDKSTWLALAGRNIVLSEELGRDVLTICNGCFGSLTDANQQLKEDASLKKSTNVHLGKIGKKYEGTVDVRHIVEFLYDKLGPGKIKEMVVKPLELKVALHYGCHLVKPSKERQFTGVERPAFFDELVEATGAESIDYPDKMACCGAGGGVRSALPEKSLEMTKHKLSQIHDAGADCIVNACPFCHLQLDSGQTEIRGTFALEYNIPVLHYSQLLGLALGFVPEELGVDLNIITNKGFFEKLRGPIDN